MSNSILWGACMPINKFSVPYGPLRDQNVMRNIFAIFHLPSLASCSSRLVLLVVDEKERGIVRIPQLGIGWPPAAQSEAADDQWGKMLTVAPVMTKNNLRNNALFIPLSFSSTTYTTNRLDWSFTLVAVNRLIIGADFLHHHQSDVILLTISQNGW